MASCLPLLEILRIKSKLLPTVYRPHLLLPPFPPLPFTYYNLPGFLFVPLTTRYMPNSGCLPLLFPLPRILFPGLFKGGFYLIQVFI